MVVIFMVNDVNLKAKFKVLGYEEGNELLCIDDDLLEISKLLDNTSHRIKERFWFCSKKRIIDTTKVLLNNSFTLHDIKYVPDDVSASIVFLLQNKLIDYETVLERFYVCGTMISPYDLPIKYSDDTRVNRALFKDGSYFSSISLNRVNSEMVLLEYIHELAHTQIDSHFGIVKNYLNREVLSIFLEKLFSLKIDKDGRLTESLNNVRFNNVLKCIELQSKNIKDTFKLEACIYVVSTLKAEHLYNVYLNGDNSIKKEILKDIQLVFDGMLGVEELLEKYDIIYDSSKMVCKRILTK